MEGFLEEVMSVLSLEEGAAVSPKEMGKVEALPGHSMQKGQEFENDVCGLGLLEYSDGEEIPEDGEGGRID